MASWCKWLDTCLPLLGCQVCISVTPCGFHGGRNGVWITFWGFSSFPYHKFHSTIYLHYYFMFLQHYLCSALRRKQRHLVVQNPSFFHDNARSHTAAAVTDLLRRWQWKILEHPPYSPDECMRLWSLRQSERTTPMDPVHHEEMNLTILLATQINYRGAAVEVSK